MTLVRRHLRLFATAWVLFQATSLSALVPRACCLAHQMALLSDCHEKAAPQASISTADEAAPPMHHEHGHMHEQPSDRAPAPAHDCALRGTCGGPSAALFTLLSTDGVLTDSLTTTVDSVPTGSIPVSRDQLLPQFESPDAPPPRA